MNKSDDQKKLDKKKLAKIFNDLFNEFTQQFGKTNARDIILKMIDTLQKKEKGTLKGCDKCNKEVCFEEYEIGDIESKKTKLLCFCCRINYFIEQNKDHLFIEEERKNREWITSIKYPVY
jgi:hypothetical protein